MKKQTWIIMGGGLLVATVLLTVWLMIFLDISPKYNQPAEEKIGNTPVTENTDADATEIDNTAPFDQIRSNGRVIAPPADVVDMPVDNPELLRAITADTLPPGWQKATWPNYLPKFNTGNIILIMEATDRNLGGWAAAIDNANQTQTADYLQQLKSAGWEITTFATEETGLFTAGGQKDGWQLSVAQNSEVNQVIISLSEIKE